MDEKSLQLVRLEENTVMSSFDCGDSDLNGFLFKCLNFDFKMIKMK